MDNFFINIQQVIAETVNSAYVLIIGLMTSLVGYFLPVKETVHILLVFFFLDIIFGYWAARKKGSIDNVKVKFSPKVIWEKTIPKMLVSFLMILTAHMLDAISPIGILTIRESVGWFISGIVLASVWQNFFIVTSWNVVEQLKDVLLNKLRRETGIKEIEDENNKEQKAND